MKSMDSDETSGTRDDQSDRSGSETDGNGEREDAVEPATDGSTGETDGGMPIDRRTVLKGAALGAGGAAIGLGSGTAGFLLGRWGGPDRPDFFGDDEHLPFDIWDELQTGLRTSPNHLPGRAAQLVEKAQRRDELEEERAAEAEAEAEAADDDSDDGVGPFGAPTRQTFAVAVDDEDETEEEPVEFETENVQEEVLKELFEFVRDEIQTVPTGRDDIDDVTEVVRWGGRGALRCGMGTPRDKAEALARLYREAGFSAVAREVDVEVEEVGLTEEEVKADLLAPPEHEGEPEIDEEDIEAWAERLGREPPSENDVEVADEDGEDSAALAASLRDVLPDDAADTGEFDWRWNSSNSSTQPVPIVEVFDDDHTRYYANLFGDVPFGEAGSDERIVDLPEPDTQTVSVTLSAAMPENLSDPFELVSGEWEVPDLVGRQLLVRTSSVIDPVEVPMIRIDDMNMFLPALALQDPHMSTEEQVEHSEFGDMLTISGDRFSADFEIEDGEVVVEDEAITRNGETFYDPETAPDPTEIETLEVEADPGNYTRIRLEVTALDGDGEHVTGLPGSVFAATDEEEVVAPIMVGNQPAPEILYMIDDSGSMRRGVSAATDEEKYDELQELMEQRYPEADIERRYVDSAMWTHLPDAVADNPDLLVYAHDGEPEHEFVENTRSLLENAPPTVLLSAYDGSAPVEDEVVLHQAELTGAEVAPMGEWDLVRETVESALEALDPPTYRFDYEVPDTQPGTRDVELFVGEDPLESAHDQATTSYLAEDSGATRALVGLYLTVEHDGREVTRTLGGWNPLEDEEWNPYGDDPDPETGFGMPGLRDFAEDTKLALLGGVDISFEGDGVPVPVAFDDIAQARHSYRDIHAFAEETGIDADSELGQGDHQELLDVWNEGTVSVQWDPMFVQAPLANRIDNDGLTYFLTPRMVVSQSRLAMESGEIISEQSLDVLPMTRASTASDGTDERFYRTLEQTARISILEDTQHDTSTLSLIGGSNLTERSNLSDHDVDSDPYADLRRHAGLSTSSYQLAPTDGSELAMWNVEENTGTLLGIMPDGTGGAWRKRTVASVGSSDQAQLAMDIYLEIMDEIDCCSVASGGAMGAVALYFEFLAALYARVTAIIGAISVDGDYVDASPGGVVAGAAGDVAKDKVKDAVPAGEWIYEFWQMAEASGL